MTVQNQPNKFTLNGDGVQTLFPFTDLRLINAEDLEVYLIDNLGNETLQVLGVDYTQNYNENTQSGDLTFFTAPLATDKVFGIRVTPIKQDSSIPVESDFDAKKIEGMVDNTVCIVQDQQDELDRSVKAPADYVGNPLTIEPVAENEVIVGNATGDGFVGSGVDASDLTGAIDQAQASAAAAASNASAASVSEGNAAASATSASTDADRAEAAAENAEKEHNKVFVAQGAINDADVVVLNNDGTVSVVTADVDNLINQYTETFSTDNTNGRNVFYDPTSNQVIVIYNKGGADVYAQVGSVNGASLDFGTEVTVTTNGIASNSSFTTDSNGNTILAIRQSSPTTSVDLIRIEFGVKTLTVLRTDLLTSGGGAKQTPVISFDDTNGYAMAIYRDNTSTRLHARVITSPSGSTAFSVGGELDVTTVSTLYYTLSYNNIESQFLISFYDTTFLGSTSVVGTITSATTATFTGSATIALTAHQVSYSAYSITDNKHLVLVRDGSDLKAFTATITFGVISLSAATVISTNNITANRLGLTYDISINRFALQFRTATGIEANIVDISSGVSIGTAVASPVSATDSSAGISKTNTQGFYFAAVENGTTDTYAYITSTSSNADDYIGISTQTVIDAANVAVTMLGGVADNLTGLTINSKYYVDADGSITTTANELPLGKAVDATTLNLYNQP